MDSDLAVFCMRIAVFLAVVGICGLVAEAADLVMTQAGRYMPHWGTKWSKWMRWI